MPKWHFAGAKQPKAADRPVAACGRRADLVVSSPAEFRGRLASERCARCEAFAASLSPKS